jgi:hypothetical protein
VSLWHPIGSPADVVRAWRARLEDLGVSQPFKQAHREVYILTPAERETTTYSNRFASHVLKQHQLAALCRARGWRYALQGAGFDGANSPALHLPRVGLTAELWVELPDAGEEARSGISVHVVTDQVRFRRADAPDGVPLSDVPALIFSEVMRDVDLFVGVCSPLGHREQGAPPRSRHENQGPEHRRSDRAVVGSSSPAVPTTSSLDTDRATRDRRAPISTDLLP